MNISDIKREVCGLNRITVPQIQHDYKLSYSEARKIVKELVEEKKISFLSGITYKVLAFGRMEKGMQGSRTRVPNTYKMQNAKYDADEDDDDFDDIEPPKSPLASRFEALAKNSTTPRLVAVTLINKTYYATEAEMERLKSCQLFKTSVLSEIVEKTIEQRQAKIPIHTLYKDFEDKINVKLLKYEFIEGLVSSNNFKTKKAWVESMGAQIDSVKDLVPPGVKVILDETLKEFKEMTLKNIQEIKKLVSDDDD